MHVVHECPTARAVWTAVVHAWEAATTESLDATDPILTVLIADAVKAPNSAGPPARWLASTACSPRRNGTPGAISRRGLRTEVVSSSTETSGWRSHSHWPSPEDGRPARAVRGLGRGGRSPSLLATTTRRC